MNIAIIPARGGSTRIPRKNVRSFYGKPIMQYSIDRARDSGLFDEIWVSSEDRGIGEMAMRMGAQWHERQARHAGNEIGTQEVMKNAINGLWAIGPLPAYACCIYATAPLMTAYDLKAAFKMLELNPDRNYVYTVDGEGVDAGQFYWGKTDAFVTDVSLMYAIRYFVPSNRVCDINTLDDWQRAEAMYDALLSQPLTSA